MTDSAERAAVRTAGRHARRAITGPERAERERCLVAHLRSLQAVHAPSVGLFVAHDGEPDLMALVESLWQNGQTVALPVLGADPADRTMEFRSWTRNLALRPGRYDIAEPPRELSRQIRPQCLLVSLTAFDIAGNRMGRGGGYFDRYLATAESQVVGVGFETQRVAAVPTQAHDVAMPIMVTDLGVRFLS